MKRPQDPQRDGAGAGPGEGVDVFRWIVLPAVVAVALIGFLVTMSRGRGGAESVTASASAMGAPAATGAVAPCIVPAATGTAGVINDRFRGKRTSSGLVYDPSEPVCTLNSAGPLGELADGTVVALVRGDGAEARCRVVGRWNGARHPERLALVSSGLARVLDLERRGTVEVTAGCPSTEGAADDSRS